MFSDVPFVWMLFVTILKTKTGIMTTRSKYVIVRFGGRLIVVNQNCSNASLHPMAEKVEVLEPSRYVPIKLTVIASLNRKIL